LIIPDRPFGNEHAGASRSGLSGIPTGVSDRQSLVTVTTAAIVVSQSRWLGGAVLAVRHSDKPGLRLSGGDVAWREDHHGAAPRELREKGGVSADPEQLKLAGCLSAHPA
jgi:ADP-ribose pyrophosphatase YjhB (NUDIX family)